MAKHVEPMWNVEEVRALIPLSDLEVIAKAFVEYEGPAEVFESAVGALFLGRFLGYDAIRILHGSRTRGAYEKILCDMSFKAELKPRTAYSRGMRGIRLAEKFKAFWKALAAGVAAEPGARNLEKA